LLRAAEFHWHFSQGIIALDQRLYIPGCLSLLTGIEASIRCTIQQRRDPGVVPEQLGSTLSNSLLREASRVGLPIHTLVVPGEADFWERLPERSDHVRIVQLRHDLAHGNLLGYMQQTEHGPLLVPEFIQPTARTLRRLSLNWCRELAAYRARELGL